MLKKVLAAIGVAVVAVAGMALLVCMNLGENYDKVFEASEESGNIEEKISGNIETAKVVLYEYADYGCTHCAEWNEIIDGLISQYPGQIAVVFRNYDLGYQNGNAVSLAATAAQLQGYWAEFKDLVFENQEEWFYAEAEELEELLIKYFETASDGDGDTYQFLADMASDAVRKKVSYENSLGKKVNVKGTPTFRMSGKEMSLSTLENKIVEKIKK